MPKYPIKKEFFPFNHFKQPFKNPNIVQKAPTTKAAVASRIDYMRRKF